MRVRRRRSQFLRSARGGSLVLLRTPVGSRDGRCVCHATRSGPDRALAIRPAPRFQRRPGRIVQRDERVTSPVIPQGDPWRMRFRLRAVRPSGMLPAFPSIEPYAGRRHGDHFARRSGGGVAALNQYQLQLLPEETPPADVGRSVSARYTRLASSFVVGSTTLCPRLYRRRPDRNLCRELTSGKLR